jgi:hypothetical protein
MIFNFSEIKERVGLIFVIHRQTGNMTRNRNRDRDRDGNKDRDFDQQISLSKSKRWYSNNCFHFLKWLFHYLCFNESLEHRGTENCIRRRAIKMKSNSAIRFNDINIFVMILFKPSCTKAFKSRVGQTQKQIT